MIAPYPHKITAQATNVGRLLSSTHNAYASIHSEAYASKPEDIEIVNDSREDLRQILIAYSRELTHIEKRLRAFTKQMHAEWKAPSTINICNWCDERQALPYSQYCGFCHFWAKDHMGNLPSEAVLELKQSNRAKFANKGTFKK